jgi:pyruvate-formate lyase-activating enzyme
LAQVRDSIAEARDKGVHVSINLLVFPGFTDRESEIEALLQFIRQTPVDMIQLRNLNIDPDYLLDSLESQEDGLGILTFLHILQQELPQVAIGSYTHPVR